jgi:hypothetical protein
MRLHLLAAASVLLSASTALAAPRAALVIGNETYMTGQPAPGAVAVAQRAAELLDAAGFEVTLALDLDGASAPAALRAFEDHVRDAEIAIVVYVGRAVSFGGSTWLVRVDADADTVAELGFSSLPLALPLGIAQQADSPIVLFDGAWPARFDGEPGLGVGSFHEHPLVTSGLVEIANPDALIVSAVPPGDEPARVDASPEFVLRALEALLDADAEVGGVEARLRAALPDAHLQGALSGAADVALPSEEARGEELEFWRRAEEQASAEAYAAYLERYPDGYYVHAARDRLDELEGGDGLAAVAEDALTLTAAQRRTILKALAVESVPPGEDPVAFGPEAREAIRAWQAAHGEEPTGFLTREQARDLLASAAE